MRGGGAGRGAQVHAPALRGVAAACAARAASVPRALDSLCRANAHARAVITDLRGEGATPQLEARASAVSPEPVAAQYSNES